GERRMATRPPGPPPELRRGDPRKQRARRETIDRGRPRRACLRVERREGRGELRDRLKPIAELLTQAPIDPRFEPRRHPGPDRREPRRRAEENGGTDLGERDPLERDAAGEEGIEHHPERPDV